MRPLFKKRIIVILLLVSCIAVTVWILYGSQWNTSTQYKFVTLRKGNIQSTITSTGTLCPVTQVQVGTQVSGTINKVLVDFNDRVRQGQVIAILDSSLLRIAVNEAMSGLFRAEAQLEEAQANYNRSVSLFEKGLVAESDFLPIKTSLKNAQASMTSAQAALDRAEKNLRYAIIRSPIDGTVIERSVEAGQTVAASFATPTLFTIAQDLSKMEIKALVDESDIGQIRKGQAVRFVVQAYPDKKFEGIVKQVRVQPTTVSNVVNYTIIISAGNKDNLLLPGMTATVDFIIESKTDVLLVPNAALRFQPPNDELAEAQNTMMKRMNSHPPGPFMNSMAHDRNAMLPPSDGEPPKPPYDMKQLWYIDSTGTLTMEPVRIGITDGTNTEVLNSHFSAGMKVVSGTESTGQKISSVRTKSNSGGPPPPMM